MADFSPRFWVDRGLFLGVTLYILRCKPNAMNATQEIIKIVEQNGLPDNISAFAREIAPQLNVTPHYVRNVVNRIKNQVDDLPEDEKQFLEQYRQLKINARKGSHSDENGETLVATSKLANSLEDIIKEFKIDTSLWEAMKFTPGSWTTPVKAKLTVIDSDKNEFKAQLPVLIENKKSTAVFQKRTSIIDYDKFRKEFIEDMKKKAVHVPFKHEETDFGNMLEMNVPDLHLGKMSWDEETGGGDYDLKTAKKVFKTAILHLIGEAAIHYKMDRILFVVGNDLFNSDTAYPITATTAGTPQQDDTRWQKIFREGRELMSWAINLFAEICPVDVLVVPGNHDFQKSFYLGEVLEAKFANNENVNINNSPRTRKYYHWGRNMLGFAHGNRKDENEARLVDSMNSEGPTFCNVDWRDIDIKEWHCGDIHHYKELKSKGKSSAIDKYAEDIDGVTIKYLRTLMFRDEWESKKGYISQKGAHCFVWNKEKGNIAEFKYNS
jgi:hypothetical protein